MENKRTSAEELKQEVSQLREKIESGQDHLAIELGFPKFLMTIEKTLLAEKLDRETLERCDFGIFRLVTESYSFEQSALGKELLDLGTKIRNLARDLPSA